MQQEITHEHKLNMELHPISKKTSLNLVQKFHYSNTLPHLNKYYLGVYIENELAGVITLGYGTRPKHTIKKLFPSLSSENYLEIGRMCVDDKFKTNTESQLLSNTIQYIKHQDPNVKLFFTWADGVYGKCGTVYQASNFLYGGDSLTEFYVYNNVRIHPLQIKELFKHSSEFRTHRPTPQEKKKFGIEHYIGKQFRYVYFLCGFSEKKRLLKESPIHWSREYPKHSDCTWKKWVAPYKFQPCEQPKIISDDFNDIKRTNSVQTTLEDILKGE